MRRLAWCVVLAMALIRPVPTAAGDKGLTNSETFSGFQFNFNNPGARSLGMGGAFVAVADDATAVIANPAGLVILQRPELSGEVKFTRFTNTIEAYSNTLAEGATNSLHSRDFDDFVVTPSFFSFVYPTERLVVAAFIRELINYESNFETQGIFFADPAGGVVGPGETEPPVEVGEAVHRVLDQALVADHVDARDVAERAVDDVVRRLPEEAGAGQPVRRADQGAHAIGVGREVVADQRGLLEQLVEVHRPAELAPESDEPQHPDKVDRFDLADRVVGVGQPQRIAVE